MIEHANLIYMPNLNIIGGTEQFVYELAKKYYMYDIAVIYKQGHENQIKRLKQFVRVIKYDNQKFKCKKLFCNYATDICKDVEAEEYIQVIHAMYKTNGLRPVNEPKITRYLAVSNTAKKEYKELTDKELEVCRNPLTFTEEDKQKPILLISATRLTKEKGKDRMIKLANLLDKAGIKWIWLIFTNDTSVIEHPNIAYMKPRLDIRPYLQLATYGVQLSDCEGDCYFTRECEALGIPLLVTPVPSFEEQGLVDGKSCYYLPFNMEIDNIERITNVPTYKGYIGEDHWEDILDKTRTNYKEEINMKFKVRALGTYKELQCTDNELGRIPNPGEIFEVSGERLEVLTNPAKNSHNRVFVEKVDADKKAPVEEKAVLPKEQEVKAIIPKKKKK